MDRSRSILYVRNAAFAVAAIAYSAIFVIISPVFLLSARHRPVATAYVRGILFLLKWICGLTYDVRGNERLGSGGALVSPAHQTWWDALVLPVLLGAPVANIDTARHGSGVSPNAPVSKLLEAYKRGQACLPVAHNSARCWPNGRWLAHPGTIIVEILEPIQSGLDDGAFRAGLSTRLEGAMRRLLRTPQRPALMPNLSPAARRLTGAVEAAGKAERG